MLFISGQIPLGCDIHGNTTCMNKDPGMKHCLQDISQHEDQTYLIETNGTCHIVDNSKKKFEHFIVKHDEKDENAMIKQVSTGDTITLGINGTYYK